MKNLMPGDIVGSGDMKIVSNKAKRILAEYLRETDKDMLEVITAFGEVFGKLESIEIDDDELLRRLKSVI